MPLLTLTGRATPDEAPLDVASIHAAHADFVWASLQRMGVRDADLDDLMQEVFVIVHRKLHTFDGTSRVTTWLFGIAMRVAAAHRRLAYNRRERASANPPDARVTDPRDGPEGAAEAAEARAELTEILDSLDLEKRVVFVMFEIEELDCDHIATTLGIPVGTVYSRLHAARKDFQAALARRNARGDRARIR
jgi:RNA polymerase sigma-70 factor (ECF subfamily)